MREGEREGERGREGGREGGGEGGEHGREGREGGGGVKNDRSLTGHATCLCVWQITAHHFH